MIVNRNKGATCFSSSRLWSTRNWDDLNCLKTKLLNLMFDQCKGLVAHLGACPTKIVTPLNSEKWNLTMNKSFLYYKLVLLHASMSEVFSVCPCQVVVGLEEVEDEGLLISWTLSKHPSFTLTVSPCKLQRKVRTSDIDTINMIGLPRAASRSLRPWECLKVSNWAAAFAPIKETHIMQSVSETDIINLSEQTNVLHVSHSPNH